MTLNNFVMVLMIMRRYPLPLSFVPLHFCLYILPFDIDICVSHKIYTDIAHKSYTDM